MPKSYYVTTPIFYVNSVPHAGHALTMLVADITKRYQKMMGRDVMYLTGTDENGLKVYEAAQAAGEDPIAFVDRISQAFRVAAEELAIDFDVFFRTTSDQHRVAVQALFQKLQENGYVYLDKYEGWYDVSAETFVKESELVDGKSPDGNEVRWVSEENYFFKLSAFGDQLLAHAEAHPEFWLPRGRRAEVVAFIKEGLRDVCITRNNPGWGIPVPGDDSKVVYVWFDALINYLAATGWPNGDWESHWPADVHWMAKEIFTRFHATLWPAMLMGAGLPLPKTIIAHGWFTFNDAKMSKSKGNVLSTAQLIERFGAAGLHPDLAVDSVRYSLARALPYDNDTNFTITEIEKHFNADLANDLGNALNRTLSMLTKYTGGVVPEVHADDEAKAAVAEGERKYHEAMEQHRQHDALQAALNVIRFMNRFIAEKKPWEMAKQDSPELPGVLLSLLYCLRAVEGLIRPFMPHTADRILLQLGYRAEEATTTLTEPMNEARLNRGRSIGTAEPMFPRIQPMPEETVTTPAEQAPEAPAKAAEKPKPAPFEPPAQIDITDFMKVNLRVARILEAEAVENSEKLVKLQVLVGEEKRQIIAGIRKSYEPADLVGRQVIVIVNLKPRKMAGLESQGMVLAADGPEGSAILLTPEAEAPEGASVH